MKNGSDLLVLRRARLPVFYFCSNFLFEKWKEKEKVSIKYFSNLNKERRGNTSARFLYFLSALLLQFLHKTVHSEGKQLQLFKHSLF